MMNVEHYSIQLRELVDDFVNRRILGEEYRSKRKAILDEIDGKINGVCAESKNDADVQDTKENVHGLFSKVIGVLKKSEDTSIP